MKTSIIKMSIMLICMTLGFANVAKGQIYSSEDCFYTEAGRSSVEYVVKFRGSKKTVWLKTVNHDDVRKNLAKSSNYYENEVWYEDKDGVKMYEYVPSMSTSQREVYRYTYKKAIHQSGCPYCNGLTIGNGGMFRPGGPVGCGNHGYKVLTYYYVAFSKDKSSFIEWYVDADDVDKEVKGKHTYTQVPKKDLLPKAANYDFLNE